MNNYIDVAYYVMNFYVMGWLEVEVHTLYKNKLYLFLFVLG